MADTATTGAVTAPPTTPQTTATTTGPVVPPEHNGAGSKEAVLADLARERDRRQALEAQLASIERAKLGDKERAEAERDDAKKAADAAQAELARVRVAFRHGLTEDDLADISTAGSADDFEARVKRYAERVRTAAAPQATTPVVQGLPPSPNAARDGSATTASVQAGRDAYAARKSRSAT